MMKLNLIYFLLILSLSNVSLCGQSEPFDVNYKQYIKSSIRDRRFKHQDIKEIVYEMRFDEASARFGEFGDFYIGLQVPLDELFRRIQI